MTNLFPFLLFAALVLVAVLIWNAIKRIFKISEESLRIRNKVAFAIPFLLILLIRSPIRDWIEEQFEPEEKLTYRQRDMKNCDSEARKAAEFSLWDHEAELQKKEELYLKSFLACTRGKGYHLTEKDAQVIEYVNNPFWKR